MTENAHQPDSNDPRTDLQGLAQGLKTLYAARVQPAAEVDESLRVEIRNHFARTAASPRRHWRTLPWAIAAVILISVTSWLIWPGYQPPKHAPLIAHQPSDIDRNGRIDILDALQLAEILDGGLASSAAFAYDINKDGTFDQRDVDFIAMEAVRLSDAREKRDSQEASS